MKILIVEDEILIQKSLQKLLKRGGADVDVTASGIEAIEMISTNDYERVVCDLMLKDITGFDIIEDSRKKYDESEISKLFIIITAYSSPQVLEKAHGYGCMIVNKPFKNIQDTINLFLGKV